MSNINIKKTLFVTHYCYADLKNKSSFWSQFVGEICVWASFQCRPPFKQLIWTSNIVLDTLMKCNKVKQLSLQNESHYQMKVKRSK